MKRLHRGWLRRCLRHPPCRNATDRTQTGDTWGKIRRRCCVGRDSRCASRPPCPSLTTCSGHTLVCRCDRRPESIRRIFRSTMNTCRALMPSGMIATESIEKVLGLHLECRCQEREPVRLWSLAAGWRVGQPSRPRREEPAVDPPQPRFGQSGGLSESFSPVRPPGPNTPAP